MVDFPDELDTSFFARVRRAWGVAQLLCLWVHPDLTYLLRKVSSMRSCPHTQMRCLSPRQRQRSRTGRKPQSRPTSPAGPWTAASLNEAT